MKKLNVVFIIIFIKVSVLGQSSWEELIQDEKSTKSEIIQSFESEFPDIKNEYYKAMKMAAENNEDFFRSKKYAKFKPYINFERYKYRVLDKLDEIDCLSDYYNSFNIYADYNYENLKEKKQLSLKSASDTWKPIGPDGYIFTQGTGFGGGGRIDRLRFHPTDPATMYACSPGGGLWKTSDDGENWIPLTDFTGVTAVSDILINPENPDILYIATGESDTWWMNGSVGILKSVDGGQNWDKTGLELPISQHVRIQRLLIHPTQPDILFAGTSIGIYASGNGGDNWEKVYSNLDVWNMEFKPGNPDIIYVGSAQGFYKSEDAGKSFRKVYSGVPSSDVDMVNIAVSQSSPDIVYAMFRGKNEANSFLGLYKSDNSGKDFSFVFNDKNLFSWDENDLKGGAGFWEMAVSDIDANYIIVGGIHNWRSKDGGQTWDRVGAHDSNLPQNKWTHCDVHFLTFLPGDTLTYFSCNDGGIYKTSDDGENWEIKIGSMGTYLTYTLGNSSISENKFVTGTQDNSTVLYNGEEFVLVGGGDGMQCFFDRTDDNYIYVTAQGGWALMSSDGGYNWSNITNYTGDAAWNAPFMQDPENSSTIYIARQRIFKSVNRGSSWQSIGSFNTSNPIFSMDICESNSSIIWCTDYWTSNIYRLEGTTNYEQFNNPSGTRIESIIAHPDDPLKAYIACTGFDPGSKVFATEDGGQTWENISNGLPNLPVNCIYYHRGSNDRIYIGLNVGLFYRDNESNGWVQMDEGLPHSEITDIDYFYPTNKLRVAVYGRGIWETEIPGTVSVNSIKSESEVIVFPNPVENVLNIKLNDNQEGIVEILDLKGQKLHEERILVDHKQLDCTNLNPGVYIIRFTTTGNKIFSSKFIKQ